MILFYHAYIPGWTREWRHVPSPIISSLPVSMVIKMWLSNYSMPHGHYHKHKKTLNYGWCHTFTFLNSCCHICTVFLHSRYKVRFHLPNGPFLNSSVSRQLRTERVDYSLSLYSKAGIHCHRCIRLKWNLTLVLCDFVLSRIYSRMNSRMETCDIAYPLWHSCDYGALHAAKQLLYAPRALP